tara:strand:- start:49 stop:342 length:294 start_codon:yes stop_codon:yes gene_type:complete
MIDTDKYELHYGHTRKLTPWTWYEDDGWFLVFRDDPSRIILEGVKAVSSTADMNLIADAPLLAAEVEWLRAWKKLVSDIVQLQDGSHLREMLKELIV